MSNARSGPASAFRYTFLTGTAAGTGTGTVVSSGLAEIARYEVVLFALVGAIAVRELWAGPLSLWGRTVVVGCIVAAAAGAVGGFAVQRFLSGDADTVGFVAVVAGTAWIAPRAAAATPLIAGEPDTEPG